MQRIRERLQSSRQNAECVITRLTTHHLRQMKRAVAGVCMASLCDDEDDLLYIFIYGFIGVRYILFIYFCITSVRIVYSHPMQRKKITKKRAMVGRVRGHNGCAKASRDSEKPSGSLRASIGGRRRSPRRVRADVRRLTTGPSGTSLATSDRTTSLRYTELWGPNYRDRERKRGARPRLIKL